MTALAGVLLIVFGQVWQFGEWPSVVDTGAEQFGIVVVNALGGLLIGVEVWKRFQR